MEWIVLPSFYRLGSKGPEVLKNLHTVRQQVKRDWFYVILNTARALNEFISISSRYLANWVWGFYGPITVYSVGPL